MADAAVVLHGPEHVAVTLAERTGLRVATAGGAADVADAAAVVGLGAEPWPAFATAHERARAVLGSTPYYAVQSWHQHPAYVGALVAALERRLAPDPEAHVLFTAPGPAEEPEPHEVVFLREVAESVTGELSLSRRSIAWVGGASRPSTGTALAALAEAHGRTRVVRCSLDPLGRPDGVHAEASAAGIELEEARLDRDALAEVLAAVVDTVAIHERLPGSRG